MKINDEIMQAETALSTEAKVEMGAWIAGLADWKLFTTITFQPPYPGRSYTQRGDGYAWSAWRRYLDAAKTVLGYTELGKSDSEGGSLGVPAYYVCLERHLSGVPHVHAILGRRRGQLDARGGAGDYSQYARELEEYATGEFGFSKVRVLRPEKLGVILYVTKYVLKQDVPWECEV